MCKCSSTELHPCPNHDSSDVSPHSCVVLTAHGPQRGIFLCLMHNDNHLSPSPPCCVLTLGTVPCIFLKLIGALLSLDNCKEVSCTASVLQICQRRRFWYTFTVDCGGAGGPRSTCSVTKLWVVLPLTSPHLLMFLSLIDHTCLWRC